MILKVELQRSDSVFAKLSKLSIHFPMSHLKSEEERSHLESRAELVFF